MNQFQELYKFYQSMILEVVEVRVKSYGWEIIKREYRSRYTKDLANLQIHIKISPNPKDIIILYFKHSWMEFLYLDRDEIPLRFDLRILTPGFGMEKARHIAQERIEVLDAIVRNDKNKIDFLGRHLGRLQGAEFHYENGIKQPNHGQTTNKKGES